MPIMGKGISAGTCLLWKITLHWIITEIVRMYENLIFFNFSHPEIYTMCSTYGLGVCGGGYSTALFQPSYVTPPTFINIK